VPSYISEQYERKGRFGYLLNRDGQDAGFEDVKSVAEHDV
jgi:beta-1,4-mannosyl-glycoprotein beta-1,4-N-acetylglucosaminyltransferase